MREPNDDNLDALLREHFAAELDGQLDRAPAVLARSSRRLPWRAAIWPVALAASVAAVFAVAAFLRHEQPSRGTPHTHIAQADDPSVEHQIAWNTVDEGTVMVEGDRPMRSIRRQRMDSFRWIDPETKASMELSIPHNEVVLIGMPAN
jgi:hypothetical protein